MTQAGFEQCDAVLVARVWCRAGGASMSAVVGADPAQGAGAVSGGALGDGVGGG